MHLRIHADENARAAVLSVQHDTRAAFNGRKARRRSLFGSRLLGLPGAPEKPLAALVRSNIALVNGAPLSDERVTITQVSSDGSFGELLSAYRRAAHLTQEELATRAGVRRDAAS